jgi:chromosome segregation protein
LQSVVVESWADGKAVVDYLSSGERGHATVLVLEALAVEVQSKPSRSEGAVGAASQLVEADPEYASLVSKLLGGVVVVQAWEAALDLAGDSEDWRRVVTLTGESIDSWGAMTGGRAADPGWGQVLAREREWRGLPRQLDEALEARDKIGQSIAAIEEARSAQRAQVSELSETLKEVEQALFEQGARRRDLEKEVDRLREQIEWRLDLAAQLERELGDLDAKRSALGTELEVLTDRQAVQEQACHDLQAELDGLQGDALYRRLSDAKTEWAVARSAWEVRYSATQALAERLAQIDAQLAAKVQRISQLADEQQDLVGRADERRTRETVVRGWLASLVEQIEPAEAEISEIDAGQEALEQEAAGLSAQLRQSEAAHARSSLRVVRQQDRLVQMREQIVDDLGLVALEAIDGVPEQPPLPMGQELPELPAVMRLPAGLEAEIHDLRGRIRRMGPVNPNAPREYAELQDRYQFLTAQAADLDEAAEALREVVAELDDIMRREFEATFQAVADRFKEKFTALFDGGSARLILTEADDLNQAGVEIMAQPPGKRQQTLALLSGGERALTAVALLFSMLEVNPPPFCVLDEVDAMLDEANIRRFRQELERLAQKTQIIIITHNRGTMEAADTLYGVSMGDDSVSQVVSLQLEGDRIASADGAEVTLKHG